jgi:hypothetical protein
MKKFRPTATFCVQLFRNEIYLLFEIITSCYFYCQSVLKLDNDEFVSYFSSQTGGNVKGGYIAMDTDIKKMISHQIKTGGLNHGQTAYLKFAGDGTSITKKETATAHSVTLSNGVQALQIGTVSLVMHNETFQVFQFRIIHTGKFQDQEWDKYIITKIIPWPIYQACSTFYVSRANYTYKNQSGSSSLNM